MSSRGLELIRRAYRHEKVSNIPWVPYTGIHVGKLTGYTAAEVLQDPEKLFESLLEANRLYDPDGQTILFDLQLEAEILGCELKWSDCSLPTVVSHPLAGKEEIPETIPQKSQGRLPLAITTIERFKKEIGDKTAAYGIFCGILTLASHLRGTAIFLDMKRNPDYVHALLSYTYRVASAVYDYYREAGVDVIAAVDPLVSQISPKYFETFLAKPYRLLFDYIRAGGIPSSFFVCGNAAHNIRLMCECNPDAVAVDENVDMAKAKRITDDYDIVLCGNIPLSTTMLFGDQQSNMKYVLDLTDGLTKEGLDIYKNLIVAPGCDMPYDTPPQNVIALGQAARNPESIREMVEKCEDVSFDDETVSLPDYDHLEKPLLEVFTLDPVACAACTYMLAVAKEAKEIMGSAVDMAEYRYSIKEDIAHIKKMGVPALPSIYIDGKLKYPSIIPSKEELVAELEKYSRADRKR